jgi:hypothetical protein
VAGSEPAVGAVAAFTGLLDEIKVYDRALTDQDVRANFNAGNAGLTDNTAVLVISTIPAGVHHITVSYNGDAISTPSSSGPAVLWPVLPAATITALTSSDVAAPFGRLVTFTATVGVVPPGSMDVAPPVGTVTFFDGTTFLGTGAVFTRAGVAMATFSTSSLAPGTHHATASYDGDTNYLASSTVHALDQMITVDTASERLVVRLYVDLLRRDVDTVGLQAWSGMLDQGAGTAVVVRGIEASLEYRTLVVKDLYRQFLRREAEPFGLGVFTTFLGAGGTAAQVESIIVGSPEYYQRQGGGSDAGFLDAVYRDLLGRPTDPSGRMSFGQALTAGAQPADVAAAIFASPEFHGRLVESLYTRYLGRRSDPFGRAAFVEALDAGVSEEEVLIAILSSPEYAGRT